MIRTIVLFAAVSSLINRGYNRYNYVYFFIDPGEGYFLFANIIIQTNKGHANRVSVKATSRKRDLF